MHDAKGALQTVHELYRQGLYLQAHDASQALGPLESWRGAFPRVLAGRLALVLGATRIGFAWHRRALREHPTEPLAVYYGARALVSCRGPWAAWQAMGRLNPQRIDNAGLAADWHMFQAMLCATWRDFQRAGEFAERALDIAPERPWIHVEHSHILECEDRLDEALVAAQRALELQAWFRPAVQAFGHLKQTAGCEQEALDFLQQASQHLECGDVLLQIADLQTEKNDHVGALASLERAEALLPLADKVRQVNLAARRSDAAYRGGDEAAAIAAAEGVSHEFFSKIIENLKKATAEDRRTVLPVPYVRQHRMTCAPATLTAISSYWQRPADHLQVAEAICYDGTPAHSERRWAQESNFSTREFTVDWPTTIALIDRGIPFTFTTVEVTTAHLQAVAGYDARRGTLLLRDPSSPRLVEMLGCEGLEHYRGYGPRGMVLLPKDEAHRLSGLTLPDADLYDTLYDVQQALEKNDRESAVAGVEKMRAEAPDHRLTLTARRMMAGYDADDTALARVADEWSNQFPDNASLLFAKLIAMRPVAPRAERLQFLQQVCSQPGCDPVFRLYWAEDLLDDARTHPQALRLIKQVLRQRPIEARCFFAMANMAWSNGRSQEALELHRIAACLEDRREFYTQQYFSAARQMGKTDEALSWLRSRATRYTRQSSDPTISLFTALNSLGNTEEAFDYLETAIKERPDAADLRLNAADAYGRFGRFELAEQALEACRGTAHEIQWLQAGASLAEYRGDVKRALEFWRQIESRDPQSADAAAAIARLQGLTEGRAAALSGLRRTLDAFPNNVALLRVALDWWRDDDPAAAEQLIDRLLAHNPAEPWMQREKAVALAKQQRKEDALREAAVAIELAPNDSWGHSVWANIANSLGQTAEAAQAFRKAIELDVDNDSAIRGLLANCATHAERVECLEYFYGQLVEQTTLGDGLLNYYQLAQYVLPPATVLTQLQAGLNARPDLWHAWSAVVRQLNDMRRNEEAVLLARDAAERFPLLPVIWLDLATSCQAAGDQAGELAALESAVQININYAQAIFHLVDAHTRRGNYREAKDVVERAIARMPLEPVLHGYLADLCWRLNLRGQTLIELRRAIELDPGYAWAWESLQSRGAEMQQPDAALNAARRLIERQPGESLAWYWLARLQSGTDQTEECLRAIQRAIELSPDSIQYRLFHSQTLSTAGRLDDAAEVCTYKASNGQIPLELRIQAAAIILDRGESAQAIDTLRQIVADNPDYIVGWEKLVAWCKPLADYRGDYVSAVEKLVELVPNEPVYWAQLGDIRAEDGDRAKAREAYSQALELAPGYQYAGSILFDLYADDSNWLPAEKVLDTLEAHEPDAWVWARRVRFCVSRGGNRKAAIAAFEKVCTTPCDGDWPLAFALLQMRNRGWQSSAEKVMKRLLGTPHHNYLLAEWVQLLGRRGKWRAAIKSIQRVPPDTFDWHVATQRLLRNWSTTKQRADLRNFVRTYALPLSSVTELWALAGYAFLNNGQALQTVAWMKDWQSRDEVAPWMLTNLVVALYQCNRDQEAALVSRAALSQPHTADSVDHDLLLASWEIRQQNFTEAEKLLEEAARIDSDAFYKALRAIVIAALATQRYASEEKRSTLAILWRFHKEMRGVRTGTNGILARIHAECVRAVLRANGHPTAAHAIPSYLLKL